jgi:hypothetical protein
MTGERDSFVFNRKKYYIIKYKENVYDGIYYKGFLKNFNTNYLQNSFTTYFKRNCIFIVVGRTFPS